MKKWTLIILLFPAAAAGQLYNKSASRFYGPFSRMSSNLKGRPVRIITEVVTNIKTENGKSDTAKVKRTVGLDYNKKGEVSVIRQYDDGRLRFETVYSYEQGLHGGNCSSFEIYNGVRSKYLEIKSIKISNNAYLSTTSMFSSNKTFGKTKTDTVLKSVTNYFYSVDPESGAIRENAAHFDDCNTSTVKETINEFDKAGNLLSTFISKDSASTRVYYPGIPYNSNGLPAFRLPDSIITLRQSGGKAYFRGDFYYRNQFNDAIRIVTYEWLYGEPRKLINEVNNTYHYDKKGNWIYWEMEERAKNEWYDRRIIYIEKRTIIY